MTIALTSVLLVDDDPNDVLLTHRALNKLGLPGSLKVAIDGERAVACLSAPPDGQPLPSLVLLDLKLPRLSGFEVLEWIRSQPGLRCLPIIVLTSSKAKRDITRAYELGANAYLIKPAAYNDLVSLVKTVADFWIFANNYAEARAPHPADPPR